MEINPWWQVPKTRMMIYNDENFSGDFKLPIPWGAKMNSGLSCLDRSARKMKYKMQVQFFTRFERWKMTVKLLWNCLNRYRVRVLTQMQRVKKVPPADQASQPWEGGGWWREQQEGGAAAMQSRTVGEWRSPRAFCVPGTVLNAPHTPTYLNFKTYLWGSAIITPTLEMGKMRHRAIRNSSKTPGLVRSTARPWTWTVWALNH